jgi:sugar lactone lactonase YvrE
VRDVIGRRRLIWLAGLASVGAAATACIGPGSGGEGGASGGAPAKAPAAAPAGPSKALQAADAMAPRSLKPIAEIAAAAGEPFKQPFGIALDADENLYVADTGGKRVCKFGKDGGFVAAWGAGEAGADGTLEAPIDLAIGPGGNLHVLDKGTGFITAFNRDGQFQSKFTGAGFYNPFGIGADASGIVVCDTGKKRVLRFDPSGQVLKEIARPDITELQEPVDVLLQPDGGLVVVDGGLGHLMRFSAEGKLESSFDALGQGPARVARMADGTYLLSNPNRGRLHRWSATGELVAVYGGVAVPEESRLVLPTGLAVDAAGDVYVVETQAHRVRKFRLE